MSKFFFNFFDGKHECADEIGLDLENTEQAYLEAHARARAMWAELLAERTDPGRCAFRVTTEEATNCFASTSQSSSISAGCRARLRCTRPR